MRPDLPAGTVTFLFTDVEGSTRLLHELGTEAYAEALAEHRRVVRDVCASHGGVEVDTQGDAFFFAFPTAPHALKASQEITEDSELGRCVSASVFIRGRLSSPRRATSVQTCIGRLVGATLARYQRLGSPLGRMTVYSRRFAAIERDTGPERYAVLCAKGAALSPDDVVELVVQALD